MITEEQRINQMFERMSQMQSALKDSNPESFEK